jgi:excinuclease ABC subunit C
MTPPLIAIQVQSLPESPGVYQYYDEKDTILYIGKAINLKKRVSSYFNKNQDNAKTRVLVSKIRRIAHMVVPTETDALLLENNLIKKYRPRYNVLLKDDKTFPWICLKKEAYPRVMTTRKVIRDGSQYFGPYTNTKMMYVLLDLIKSLYPLRSCTLDLSADKVAMGKYTPCLEYHIGNCKAPCVGKQTPEDYAQDILAVTALLKGRLKEAVGHMKLKMKLAAEALAFEEAQKYKERLDLLSGYQSRATVVSPNITHVDVYSIFSDQTHGYVNYMEIAHGAIIRTHTLELKKRMEESDEILLEMAIVAIRERFQSAAKTLVLPFKVLVPAGLRVEVPQLGDKKKLLDLSLRNAKHYRQDQLAQLKVIDPQSHSDRILAQLQKDLRLPNLPVHIECFDNSNIQGTNPVAACVVFQHAKPAKSQYRHFHIKTVEGPDDFASMREVVTRRYRRMIEEGSSLPQLVVIDGGKGQLSAALDAFDSLGIRGKIAIIGIAKRLEEIYFPGDSVPIYLDKRSTSLKLIQQLRNEAHRFGITFHRQLRSNAALGNRLETLSGIGAKTAEKLLTEFKSVKRVEEASLQALADCVGMAKAQLIYEQLKTPADA